MVQITDKKKCSGCAACSNICPTKAIFMRNDSEGFLYPDVDLNLCINCNKCEKVCPYLNDKLTKGNEMITKCFAAFNKNESDRIISSSGGLFIALAKCILLENGVVYGAAFDSEFLVYHKKAESTEEIYDLVGSKYLQSRMGYIYQEVKSDLKKGRDVLFVGSTCQIAGLKAYLGHSYSNLLCVDFICLGIPSPLIWKKYIEAYFKKINIKSINFKDKTKGWNSFSLRISGETKDFVKRGRKTKFFSGYFKGLYSRPSCSECIFKCDQRISDLTIADCWGSKYIASELDDNKGLSSIIIHSSKGLEAFEKIKAGLMYKEISLNDIKLYNENYYMSKKMGENREQFWEDCKKLPAKKLFSKYCKIERKNLLIRIRNYLKNEIRIG